MKFVRWIGLLLFCAALLVLTFRTNFAAQIKEFQDVGKMKAAVVSEYVEISGSFIDLMTLYGNNFLKSAKIKESELYGLLQYDGENDQYHLDAIENTKYEAVAGNLTGLGKIPDSGIYRSEINLALEYNKYFSCFYDRLPQISWIYYTSENNFISIYPWVKSSSFQFDKQLQKTEFYTFAASENNRLRESVWTPVYLDQAGKGLMVTLSSPIYHDDTFMGVVSVDLTTTQLGKLIESEYQSYLVDIRGSVIAIGHDSEYGQEEKNFGELLGFTEESMNEIELIRGDTVKKVGSYYFFFTEFGETPWKMYFVTPVRSVLWEATAKTFPILLICILLFWSTIEDERRRRTEIMLTNSLEEIKSYHVLLESAAKHDFLTDTCNRRGLYEAFHERMNLNTGRKIPVSIILGDIDNFKQFNDTFGHTAGDRVLVEIAGIIKSNTTEEDIICRWGGEEFVIVLNNKTCKEAALIAERLRKEIELTEIPWTDAEKLKATMTFGVAEHDFEKDIQNTVSKADNAMYIGKGKGKNQVSCYQKGSIISDSK